MTEPAKRKQITVVIAAKDEAMSLGSTIHRTKEALSAYEHEIIVVDDNSKDKTSEIAKSNDAIVISHTKNLGKGSAMKTGTFNVQGDIIVFLDGDGAHNPKDIPRVTKPILEGQADLVIGSRSLDGSEVPTSPVVRKFINMLASFVVSVVISFLLPIATFFSSPVKWIRITDCTSGLRAINKESWDKLDIISSGFEVEVEMIYEATINRLTITEAPISCDWNSRHSHLSILGDGSSTLALLARKLVRDIGGRKR